MSFITGRICDICKEFIPHYMNHSNCSPRPKKKKLDMDSSLEPLPNTEPRVDVEVVEVEPEIILKHYYNDPDVQAKLIQAVKARPPLWNYKIKLKDRSENIKRILWDEIFVEMGGVVAVDELQAKWTYLKEKYCREKKKCGNETGLRKQWAHFNSLAFLDEIVRNTFEKSPDINLDVSTTDIKNKPNVLAKKSNHKNLEQTRSPKLILPSVLLDNNDMAFSKYLCSILKDVPKKKKRKIQADIIFNIIKEIDDNNK